MLSFVQSFHQTMVWIILALGAGALITGIALLAMRRANSTSTGLSRLFRLFLGLAAASGVVQALLGLLLVFQGCQPRDNLHYVYGIIVLAAVPVAYAYSDQKQVRRDIIIMTIAAVAIIGAAFRGLATGPGGICH